MEQCRFYIVRGAAKKGTITYKCPTVDWALRKLRDFKAADREDIMVTNPDGTPLTEAELIGLVDGSGAAPSDEAIPAALLIARQTVSI